MAFNALSDFVLDQLFGYQTATKLKNNIVALASARIIHELGGTRLSGIASASFVPVPDYRHPKINGANLSGLTARVRVQYRTDSTGTAVDWQVVDLDSGSPVTVVAAGTAYSADTSWQEEEQTITLDAGDHHYELQVKGANTDAEVQALGRIEIYATA